MRLEAINKIHELKPKIDKPLEKTKGEKIIKVAIIEDLDSIAAGLRELFEDQKDMSCKQVYGNAEDAIHFLPESPADVVLVDIGLPGADGIEAIIRLRETCPDAEFCMFTVFEDNDKIFKSLQAGAKGYILKNAKPQRIIDSIRELHLGGSPINPDIARKVINAFTEPVKPQTKVNNLPLTKREFELLDLLAQGLFYKEISTQLGITIGTVKQHVHKIYHKLQVNNRTEAINKYLKR